MGKADKTKRAITGGIKICARPAALQSKKEDVMLAGGTGLSSVVVGLKPLVLPEIANPANFGWRLKPFVTQDANKARSVEVYSPVYYRSDKNEVAHFVMKSKERKWNASKKMSGTYYFMDEEFPDGDLVQLYMRAINQSFIFVAQSGVFGEGLKSFTNKTAMDTMVINAPKATGTCTYHCESEEVFEELKELGFFKSVAGKKMSLEEGAVLNAYADEAALENHSVVAEMILAASFATLKDANEVNNTAVKFTPKKMYISAVMLKESKNEYAEMETTEEAKEEANKEIAAVQRQFKEYYDGGDAIEDSQETQ